MFERFTDRARRVVALAREHAGGFGHDYIGTEHLLLGLVHESGGVAAKALVSLGVSTEMVRERVAALIENGPGTTARHVPFTPKAKRVLELSLREALMLGHNYIGTEHMLLGLLRLDDGVAVHVLSDLSVTQARAREAVLELLHGELGQIAAGGGPVPRVPRSAKQRRKGSIGPACPECSASLERESAYRIVDVPEFGGAGTAKALYLFCVSCGRVLDIVFVPDDEVEAPAGAPQDAPVERRQIVDEESATE
jgi:ATP-dependent Clp protease ATP-binding subunit ClpA